MDSLNVNTEQLDDAESSGNGNNGGNQNESEQGKAPTNVDMDALAAELMKRLNGKFILRNLADLGANQMAVDSSPDLDLEFNERRISKQKGWRSKLEKDVDKLFKALIRNSRAGSFIEKMMIEGFNNNINVNNIYKNGNIEARVANLVPMLARGVMNYIKKSIDNEAERQRFMNSLDGFHDTFTEDCVMYQAEECLDLLKKLYIDLREDRDKLDVDKNNLELRGVYCNTKRRPWRRNNNYYGNSNGYGGNENSKRWNANNGNKKRVCLDWNKKGKCTYKNCRYPHECSSCGSTQHGSVHCKEAASEE